MRIIVPILSVAILAVCSYFWMGSAGERYISLNTKASVLPARQQMSTGTNNRTEIEIAFRQTRPLVSLAEMLGSPKSGEWRSNFKEQPQSFLQYAHDGSREKATSSRGVIVIQPVGDINQELRSAIVTAGNYLSAYYGLRARVMKAIPVSEIPRSLLRKYNNTVQLNAEGFMQEVMAASMPSDAAAMLAVTNLDLWPGAAWPFESALGWSAFHGRTATLSTYRSMGPGALDRGNNLLRLCKLATHEVGHAFTMKHCHRYACNFNGCADMAENDQKPLWPCPDCLAKLSLATKVSARDHCLAMERLCKEVGFRQEVAYYQRALRYLDGGR